MSGLTYDQMMERIRKVIPKASPEDMKLYINEGSDTFCEETEILEEDFPPITSVASQMFYDIDPRCLGVRQVDIDGTPADRAPGENPSIEIGV